MVRAAIVSQERYLLSVYMIITIFFSCCRLLF